VTIRAPHIQEERLLDSYLSERAEEPIDPPVAEHLAGCDACAVRYAEFTQFMDGLRTEAAGEADAIFTPERLLLQQQQIVRRLEHVGRAARVISFPGRFTRSHTDVSARMAPRWVAAVAAAGVIFGVGLGASLEWERRARSERRVATIAHQVNTARPSRLVPVATRGSAAATVADDDAFLSELDLALERPRTRELLAFDAFTPHVREIKNGIR
jgi:anti-sigma factor RsiW